jgi:hypothetical protein
MKKLLLTFGILFIASFAVIAQDAGTILDETFKGAEKKAATKGDRLVIDVFNDMWQDVDSNVTASSYSPGMNFYGMYNIYLGGSFGIGFGFGFGMHNFRSDAFPVKEVVYDSIHGYTETGNTIFQNIPGSVNNKKVEYDINKMSMAYFDIPLELRYKNTTSKGKVIRFSIGGKAGYLINGHTKYRGTKFTPASDSDAGTADVKYKTFKIDNIENLRYGAVIRFGYSYFNVYGYYSLSKIFKEDKGPEMYPISVGLSVII